MQTQGIDHIELYVADLARAVDYLRDGIGLAEVGTAQAAGQRSLVLSCGTTPIVVTSGGNDGDPGVEFVRRHGDGVGDVALRVEDAAAAFHEAVARGAVPIRPPVTVGDRGARVTLATVGIFGDVEHTLVQRDEESGEFLPGRIEITAPSPAESRFSCVDHVAICLRGGDLDETASRYERVLGFTQILEETVVVGDQAMRSKVVQDRAGGAVFTMLEPDVSRQPGQLDAFLSAHGGSGVQHVAMRTDDIAGAVGDARTRGVEFLTTPSTYYDALAGRLGTVPPDLARLRAASVLADRDEYGLILQIFARSVHPRNTFFVEIVERRGARTFGSANIKALYEAVERGRPDELSAGRHPREGGRLR